MHLQRIQEKRQPPPAKSNTSSPNTHLEYLPKSRHPPHPTSSLGTDAVAGGNVTVHFQILSGCAKHTEPLGKSTRHLLLMPEGTYVSSIIDLSVKYHKSQQTTCGYK